MKKIISSIAAVFLLCTIASAQVNQEEVQRRVKDPATTGQAAKADVYILKNKTTIDTLNQTVVPQTTERKKSPKRCKKSS